MLDDDQPRIVFEPRNDKLDGSTNVYQVEDGTLFYYDGHVLYVKSKGRNLSLDLPYLLASSRFEVRGMGACGNAMYFEANRKIHKVFFDRARNRIEIRSVRDLLIGEKVLENAITIRERNGKEFAFRMSWVEEGREVIGLAGNRIFYRTERAHNWLWKTSANSFLIEIRERNRHLESHHARNVKVYARKDSSAEVFVSDGEHMAIVHDDVMEPLLFTGPEEIKSIVGVHNGVLTVLGMDEGRRMLCSARIHDAGSISRRSSSRQSGDFVEEILDRNEKLEAELKASIEDHARQMTAMQGTIDCLQKQNDSIRERMASVEEMLVKITAGPMFPYVGKFVPIPDRSQE